MNIFITLLFLFSFNTFASGPQKKELIWGYAIPNRAIILPKVNVLNENHPIMKLFMNELKDYKQTSMPATINRIEEDIKNKKLVCYPGSSEFSRRREFAYLTSQYIQPAPQLVVTRELGNKLLAKYNGKISLNTLIADKSIKGALAEGRSYGESIDRILSKQAGNITRHVFNTPINTAIEQLRNRRIDYTLEYPFFVDYMNTQVSSSHIKVISIPLSDVETFVTQYTACSKTKEGLEIIKRIDRVVMKNVRRPEYWTEALNSVPQKDRDVFVKNMKNFIQYREKNSLVIQ